MDMDTSINQSHSQPQPQSPLPPGLVQEKGQEQLVQTWRLPQPRFRSAQVVQAQRLSEAREELAQLVQDDNDLMEVFRTVVGYVRYMVNAASSIVASISRRTKIIILMMSLEHYRYLCREFIPGLTADRHDFDSIADNSALTCEALMHRLLRYVVCMCVCMYILCHVFSVFHHI